MDARLNSIIQQGSQTFEYSMPIVAAGALAWLHMEDIFPQGRMFLPFDSIEVVNNSAQSITLYIGSIADPYTIPAYMIKPIARRSFYQVGIRNNGAADTVAGDILIHAKRLRPDVQAVISERLTR